MAEFGSSSVTRNTEPGRYTASVREEVCGGGGGGCIWHVTM